MLVEYFITDHARLFPFINCNQPTNRFYINCVVNMRRLTFGFSKTANFSYEIQKLGCNTVTKKNIFIFWPAHSCFQGLKRIQLKCVRKNWQFVHHAKLNHETSVGCKEHTLATTMQIIKHSTHIELDLAFIWQKEMLLFLKMTTFPPSP
jgi:hypothetical protein